VRGSHDRLTVVGLDYELVREHSHRGHALMLTGPFAILACGRVEQLNRRAQDHRFVELFSCSLVRATKEPV
jgi:hypothetical protein